MKLAAVLNAIFASTLGRPLLSGNQVCTRSKMYSATTETKLKASSAIA